MKSLNTDFLSSVSVSSSSKKSSFHLGGTGSSLEPFFSNMFLKAWLILFPFSSSAWISFDDGALLSPNDFNNLTVSGILSKLLAENRLWEPNSKAKAITSSGISLFKVFFHVVIISS